MNRRSQLLLAACTSAIFVACGADGPTASDPPADPVPGAAISQTFAVSECGGFGAAESRSEGSGAGQKADTSAEGDGEPAASPYCAAERLDFAYDALSGKLALTNARVMLNCCGGHSVKLSKLGDGAYELREVDAPELVEIAGQQQPARCHCMCPFDFTLEAESIPAGTIALRIVREVTDSGAPAQQVYAGQLDLSQGQGTLVVDGEPVIGFCE